MYLCVNVFFVNMISSSPERLEINERKVTRRKVVQKEARSKCLSHSTVDTTNSIAESPVTVAATSINFGRGKEFFECKVPAPV